jgi:hypothetical protein
MLQFMSTAVPAYLALARNDTATALRLFGGLSREGIASFEGFSSFERLTEGILLARRGRETEALEVLDRAFPVWWWTPLKVMSRLETARAAERLGQRERAVTDYQYVLDVWRHADPVLQPHVTEARSALTRLSTERP